MRRSPSPSTSIRQLVLMGLRGPLSSIDEFIAEAVGDRLTEQSRQAIARILDEHDEVDEVAELRAEVERLAARIGEVQASIRAAMTG